MRLHWVRFSGDKVMTLDQIHWLIAWTYVVANTGRVISYLPQIRAVWKCSDGARSISLITWSYWSFSHLSAVLYAGMVIDDGKLLAVSLGNMTCCITVGVLTALRRRAFRHTSKLASSNAA
jgi:hypothetical protein